METPKDTGELFKGRHRDEGKYRGPRGIETGMDRINRGKIEEYKAKYADLSPEKLRNILVTLDPLKPENKDHRTAIRVLLFEKGDDLLSDFPSQTQDAA